tara:strand:+ start:38329 stop:38745 length:417 start_codon:yes stop_codon:yes gene_type:complete
MPLSLFVTLVIILLVFISIYLGYLAGSKIQKLRSDKEFRDRIPELRKDAISKSRSVLTGQFSEQIAPILPEFPYNLTEVRFMGKPIDFLVFKGLDTKKVEEVVFLEIKTGQSQLSNVEKSLKETIKNKKVKWEEYRID